MTGQPSQLGDVDLLISPIGELVTPCLNDGPAHGSNMGSVMRIKNATVAVRSGLIVDVGREDEVLSRVKTDKKTLVISAANKLMIPGLIDPHTHTLFAGNRANEFVARCQGKTYGEIARAGGGIVASMTATRKASKDELISLALKRLKSMLSTGTTTCEIKTGYGLDFATEIRMLEAISVLSYQQPIQLIPTFMAAHAIPPDCHRGEYIELITGKMLPGVAELISTREWGELPKPFNDVFCDEGYFTLAETRQILETGAKFGLRPKVHADEFCNLGATSLAVELQAVSADHLLMISNHEIDLLAQSNTVAVLLPGTSFYLNLSEHAPARTMIERGVAVALGSDFNPGSCHISSLLLIWALACLHLKMTPEEALTALTVNAAYAVGLGGSLGQVRVGYKADFVIFDLQALDEVPYNLGSNQVSMVFKQGKLVCDRQAIE